MDSPVNRPAGRLILLFACILLTATTTCRPGLQSNFGVDQWAGWTLDGESVQLDLLGGRGLVLNVYSPTCGPCIEELPALHVLYERARALEVPMFIVATSEPSDHGIDLPAGSTPEQRRTVVMQRLREDVAKYGIEVPVLVMDDRFQVSPADGLITGTPETLFFRREPVSLEYNFIGPLSVSEAPAEIVEESRFQFALRVLDRVRSENVYERNY